MKVAFDKSLETGNELIDQQHRELIDRVNKLLESCEDRNEKRMAIQTLNFLLDYTVFHFEAEEKLQEESGYPDLKGHKAQHQDFIKSVNELLEMLEEEEGPTDAFVSAVNTNITQWLLNHIQIRDKAVAAYIQAKA
jgi:hemerythrin